MSASPQGEHAREHPAVRCIVVHGEDAHIFERKTSILPCRYLPFPVGRLFFQTCRKPEGGTDPLLAFHSDPAAHYFTKPP
jgi:hypothetical protein